jgi:Tol biopolymer transport system component
MPMTAARIATALVVVLLTGCAWIQRSSVSSAPGSVQGNQASDEPSLGGSGAFVAFSSSASNLVPGDTNGVADVFVRDHTTGRTERVSLGATGVQANGASRRPSISDDGRYVAFETDATNLPGTGGDTFTDVVVRDRELGTTTTVSINPNGTPMFAGAVAPVISGDGHTVAFLVRMPVQGWCCIDTGPYVRDLAAGVTTQMPATYGDIARLGRSALSDDGRRIVYGEARVLGDVVPFSVVTADTREPGIETKLLDGQFTQPSEDSFDQALSGDGKTAVVTLVAPGMGIGQVHRIDVVTRRDTTIGSGLFDRPALSADGSVIALRRLGGGAYVVVRRDGSNEQLISADTRGMPAHSVGATDLSDDGRFVAFSSSDGNLVPGDTNGVADVFTRAVNVGVAP